MAAKELANKRVIPVNRSQRVAHEAAQASHYGECGQTLCVVLGHGHIEQVGSGWTLASLKEMKQNYDEKSILIKFTLLTYICIKVQQNRSNDGQEYSPNMITRY